MKTRCNGHRVWYNSLEVTAAIQQRTMTAIVSAVNGNDFDRKFPEATMAKDEKRYRYHAQIRFI